MMILHWLTSIALAVAQAAGPSQVQPASGPATTPPPATGVVPMGGFDLSKKSTGQITETQAETIRSQCGDRRFEASAEGMIDGAMKRRRISLCAAPGDSEAQWIVKLENAKIWVRAQKDLSDPVKDKLVDELADEIALVRARGRSADLSSGALPAADALVATVPPMPLPLASPTISASSLLAPPGLARLPLTIRCLAAGDRGEGGRCANLYRDTLFVVHAEANLARPPTLRFLRRGEARADVPIDALRRGQSVRIKLPPEVCSRVTGTVLTIQIVAQDPKSALGGRVAEEVGPFRLRC